MRPLVISPEFMEAIASASDLQSPYAVWLVGYRVGRGEWDKLHPQDFLPLYNDPKSGAAIHDILQSQLTVKEKGELLSSEVQAVREMGLRIFPPK